MTVANRTVVKVEADLVQTKRMLRKRHGRTTKVRTGKSQAREGHSKVIQKKDTAEIDKEGQVSM